MKRLSQADHVITVIVIGLVIFGAVMVYSATYYMSQISPDVDEIATSYFTKQLVGAAIGLVMMIMLSFVDYHIYNKRFIVGVAILVSIVLLVMVLVLSADVNGAKRWINIGGISFQPSEIARISLIMFVAHTLTNNTELVRSKKIKKFLNGSIPLIIFTVVISFLIGLENLSMTMVILMTIVCMMIVAGVSFKALFAMFAASSLAGVAGILAEPYRIQRALIFTAPWTDSADTGYQLMQSLYALGAGGLVGVGLGDSKQKLLYLTYGESDFILSIIGEELGFIGIALLLIVFVVLIWRCLLTAIKAPDMFGMLLATGVTSIIAIQVIMNVAVVTSSMPPTGVPLPFISAGNTSLIMFMSSIGIILNISKAQKKIT